MTHYASADLRYVFHEEHVDQGPKHLRPVVVIDPEDREAVKRLVLLVMGIPQPFDIRTDDMQAALREFVNPKPPKPEEPTDPAARVWACGTRWAKVGSWWVTPAMGEGPRQWDYLTEQEDFAVE